MNLVDFDWSDTVHDWIVTINDDGDITKLRRYSDQRDFTVSEAAVIMGEDAMIQLEEEIDERMLAA